MLLAGRGAAVVASNGPPARRGTLAVLCSLFFFNDPAPPEISPLPLPDALPISHLARLRRQSVAAQVHGHGAEARLRQRRQLPPPRVRRIRKSVQEEDGRGGTRSEEHT